jgi:D-serine deaminase-like pyridoxal phosphate-dependent protein
MSDLYTQYKKALTSVPSPALYLDLDAFEKNIKWALDNSGSKKIRVATKSIRCAALIKKVLESSPNFQGLMSFTIEESLWLKSLGFKDILMGYPTMDQKNLEALSSDPSEITLMVDLPEHVHYLAKFNAPFRLCLDLDLSMDLPFVRFGVYRSSLQTLERLKEILMVIKKYPQLKLVGAMGYEAQIAGVMDKESWLMRFLKKLSINQLRKRRALMVKTIIDSGFKLDFVNGGGTGSMKSTREENCVTEITVGSGFFAPVLFDHYQDFTLAPAMGFTLPIVRQPMDNIYTCLGGGYIASGENISLKTPTPFLPKRLSLLKNEGAGEVQTPMKYSGTLSLAVGDIVFMRHAKAGEACERFNSVHLIRGDKYHGSTPTYRGDGKSFL